MIKKILFSLLFVLTITLTFVGTKVSADTPTYELTPIEVDTIIPYDTLIYYDNIPTNSYDFVVDGTGVAEGLQFIYRISVDSNGMWNIYIYDDGFELLGSQNSINEFISLTSYNSIVPVAGDFRLVVKDEDTELGNLCLKTEIVNPPVENESNAIYNGVFELLADTLYGGTENLNDIQVGVLEWFSILITLSCLLLPFILVFFVIKLLFK